MPVVLLQINDSHGDTCVVKVVLSATAALKMCWSYVAMQNLVMKVDLTIVADIKTPSMLCVSQMIFHPLRGSQSNSSQMILIEQKEYLYLKHFTCTEHITHSSHWTLIVACINI